MEWDRQWLHAHTVKKHLTYCNYGTKSSLSRHKSHIKLDPGQDKPSVERWEVKHEYRSEIRADKTSVFPRSCCVSKTKFPCPQTAPFHTPRVQFTPSVPAPQSLPRRALPPRRRMLHSLPHAPITSCVPRSSVYQWSFIVKLTTYSRVHRRRTGVQDGMVCLS